MTVDTLNLGQAISEYNPRVRAQAWQLSRNRADVDDLTQEVWIKAWQYKANISDLGGWLWTVTRNTWVSHHRYPKHTLPVLTDLWVLDDVLEERRTFTESAEESMFRQHLPAEVVQAIRKLPDDFRYPFLLYYACDLSDKQVCSLLDISPRLFKSRMNRARLILRNQLQHLRKDYV